MGEQWAQILPRTAAGTDQGRQRLLWEQVRGPDIAENEPQAGFFRKTDPATPIGPRTGLVQSILSSAGFVESMVLVWTRPQPRHSGDSWNPLSESDSSVNCDGGLRAL